ncbi:hypothetical protein [Magnetococcus sp. PR-3]
MDAMGFIKVAFAVLSGIALLVFVVGLVWMQFRKYRAMVKHRQSNQ